MTSAVLGGTSGDGVLCTNHQDGVLVAEVSGDVDLATVNPIANELIGLVARRPRAVVVDLRTVTYLGTIGVTLLLDVQQYAEQVRVPFTTIVANRAVLRPLRLVGADRVLRPHATLQGALSAVRAQHGCPDPPASTAMMVHSGRSRHVSAVAARRFMCDQQS